MSENAPTGEWAVLTLESFKARPCVDFGRAAPGERVSAALWLQNDAAFAQTVVVERVPAPKKGQQYAFSATPMKQMVEAQTRGLIEFSWTPAVCGNFREMVQLKVDGGGLHFRLVAILVGECPLAANKQERPRKLAKKRCPLTDVVQSAQETRRFSPAGSSEAVERLGVTPADCQSPRRETYAVSTSQLTVAHAAATTFVVPHAPPTDLTFAVSADQFNSTMVGGGDAVPPPLLPDGVCPSTIKRPHGALLPPNADTPSTLDRRAPVAMDISPPGDAAPALEGAVRERMLNLTLARQQLAYEGCVNVHEKKGADMAPVDPPDSWFEAQELGLTAWLNSVLRAEVNASSESAENQSKESLRKVVLSLRQSKQEPVPSREQLSLRTYAETRQLNDVRSKAVSLFRKLQPLLGAVADAVEGRRFGIRRDRQIHADVGLQVEVANVLRCVYPLWLRLGLEVVFGEAIPLRSNADVDGLWRFAVHRLLVDPAVRRRHGHAVLSTHLSDDSVEANSRLFLIHFLQLFIFLDRAKSGRLIAENPRLFLRSSKFKSVKAVLNELVSEFISGEGNLLKTLGRLGYRPVYEQQFIDEYRFSVENLKRDLRDGIILTRVVEVLTGQTALSDKLREPTDITRKAHNVSVAFAGLPFDLSDIPARQIVLTHREYTLELLWRIVIHFEVTVALSQLKLEAELELLKTELTGRGLPLPVEAATDEIGQMKLLLDWCRHVCALRSCTVTDFASSFGDGRVLCHLLSVYCPQLLAEAQVAAADGGAGDALSSSKHFGLFRRAVSELDGMPDLLNLAQANGNVQWNERLVVVYVSLLCGRLLEAKRENAAATRIQRFFVGVVRRRAAHRDFRLLVATVKMQRLFRLKLERRRRRLEFGAALTIQRYWRQTGKWVVLWSRIVVALEQNKSARLIQAKWRAYRDQRRFERVRAATALLQRVGRGALVRRRLRREREAAVVMQSAFRGHRQRRRFVRLRAAAVALQRRARENELAKVQRAAWLESRRAAVVVQSWWRMARLRRQFAKLRRVVLVVQSVVRVRRIRQQLLKDFEERLQRQAIAATRIQAAWRCVRERRRYLLLREREAALKDAVVGLQARWRMTLQRRRFLKQQRAAVVLQAWYRGARERRSYVGLTKAVVFIQQAFRSRRQRFEFLCRRRAAVRIQAAFRAYRVRRDDTAKLRALRQRVAEATAYAIANPHQTLDARTRRSVHILLTQKSLTAMKNALVQLDVVTRLSAESCQTVVAAGVVAVLWDVVADMNRAVPSVEVLAIALGVIVNIANVRVGAVPLVGVSAAQYGKTAASVCERPGWLDTLISRMSAFRKTKPSVFVDCCLLLVALSHRADVHFEMQKESRKKALRTHLKELTERRRGQEKLREADAQKYRELMRQLVAHPDRSPLVPEFFLDRVRPSEWLTPLHAIKLVAARIAL